MRKLIIFILLCASIISLFAQQTQPSPQLPVDPDSKLITYKEVVNQDGNKDFLYDRGAEWLRAYYLSPVSVAKVQDKVNGKIEGTARIPLYYQDETGLKRDAGIVYYDLKLEFKDGKYRYILTNFHLKASSMYPLEKYFNKSDPAYNANWESYLYQTDTTMRSLIVNLKKGMLPKVIKKDEW